MKEFHILMDAAIKRNSVQQLKQLCNDSQNEIKYEGVGFLESALTLDKYYATKLTYTQISRLGRFIKSGKHKIEFTRYV